jgi:DNA invertase Pin-like site-specific DNA recombinase
MHGIVKFQVAEHNKLIKEGQRKAKERGVIIGRPTKVTDDMRKEVAILRDNKVGIKTIAKKMSIGVGTVYNIMEKNAQVQ